MRTLATVALLLAALLTGCGRLQTEGDFFFVRSAGADLPVWVRGNTDSGVFMVVLAGGPGDSGMSYVSPVTESLEEKYAVVYWDQRAAGVAQGNPTPETISLEQFVADTHAVISTLRQRHGVQKLFLFGPSWGGTLGTAYLLEHQEGVAGWIDLDGSHDWQMNWDFALDYVKVHAERKLAAGEEVDTWRGVPEWAESMKGTRMSSDNLWKWQSLCTKAGGYFHDPSNSPGAGADLLLFSPFSLGAQLANDGIVLEKLLSDDAFYDALRMSSKLSRITIPSLVLWGRHDGAVPVAMAHDAHDNLGTPPEHKFLVIFEKSAHMPPFEEPEAFLTAVTQFIEKYR